MDVKPYKLMTIFFIIMLLILQYRLWFESGGIIENLKLKKQLTKESEENDKLRKRNLNLLGIVKHLQENHASVESNARHDLGMIKKGETFYQIVR